ncbi:MAG: DNA polymerase [Pseudomonadales bacterium]
MYLPDIRSKTPACAKRLSARRSTRRCRALQPISSRAMIRVSEWLQHTKTDARMIMQVHDELVFEVAERDVETVRETVCSLMSAAAELHVPLVVDAEGIGDNWDEAH